MTGQLLDWHLDPQAESFKEGPIQLSSEAKQEGEKEKRKGKK